MAQKKYTDGSGVSEIWLNIKNYIASQLLGKSDVGHTHSASDITSGLATVATSGSYEDLSNKPTIPTVNNATLTIQKNSSNVATFTANASSNVTANISVPTKVSELTNDSGFITSSGSCNYANSAGAVAWDNVSGKPSTFTPSSHTHNYAGSSNAGGAASSTLKLETYKQGSTTETYGANYPIFAQWVDGNNVALKCTNYTVCVDKANSVAWDNVTDKPSFSSNTVQIGYTTQKTGTWTLTGVVPYKPVIFYFSIWNSVGSIALPNNNAAWVVGAKQTSTSSSDYNHATRLWMYISGDENKYIVKASALIIPLSSTVSIRIDVSDSKGVNLYAYQ